MYRHVQTCCCKHLGHSSLSTLVLVHMCARAMSPVPFRVGFHELETPLLRLCLQQLTVT